MLKKWKGEKNKKKCCLKLMKISRKVEFYLPCSKLICLVTDALIFFVCLLKCKIYFGHNSRIFK